MSDERRKHGWAFWLTVALIASPLLYVASFGPVFGIATRLWAAGIISEYDMGGLLAFYYPLQWLAFVSPTPVVANALEWYAGLFS